jgi:hypothetical protein
MTTKHGHENGDERNPSVGYDKSDLSARGILIFFVVLALFTIAMNLGVIGMYFGMTRIAEKHDPEVSPLASQTITPRSGIMTNTANVNIQKFPEPRLQTNDVGDMTKFLVQETATLTAQPWQDAQGNMHLPIDQAMKMVESRLPVRAGNAVLPNYPGAGREYANPSAPDDMAGQQNETVHGEVQNPAAIN